MANTDEGDFWGKPGRPAKEPAPQAEDFWGKGGKEPEQPGDFWSKAEASKQRQREQAATPSDEQRRLKRRRRRRVWLIAGGGLLVLLLLLVALAPTIAGSFAPGIIEKRAGEQIAGSIRVKDTSFGWFGPQRVTGLELRTPDGGVVATATAEVAKGLFGFLTGSLDLGTVTLSGVRVDVVKRADGTTNLQEAVAPQRSAPPPPKDAGEARLPDSLRAHVIARNMQVTFTDLTRGGRVGTPTATIKNADMDLTLGAGEPLTLTLEADAVSGQQTGKIAVDVDAQRLIRKDGLVQPAKATVDASVELIDLPLALADALAPLPRGASVREGLGETIDLTLKAKGNLDDARAQLTAAAQNLQASGNLKVAKGVLTTESPFQAAIKGSGVRALVPQIDASLAEQGTASLEAFPDVTVSIADLRFPVASSGAMDLRGAAGVVTLGLTETRGTVTLSGGRPETFHIAPLEARVETSGLDQGARVTAATTATISGQPAGEVNVDLRLAGLLDSAGAPVKGPPGTIEGVVAVRKIATAIAQPFLAATRLDLPRDIGPTLDVQVQASTDTRGVAAGATPPTSLTMAVTSEGLRVGGGLEVSQATLRTLGEGLKVEVVRPAGIAASFLDPAGNLRLAPTSEAGRGQGMVLTVKGLNVPRNTADGALLLERAQAQVDIALSGIVVEPAAAPRGQGALALNNTAMTVNLDAGSAVLNLNSAMVYEGQAFSAKAGYEVPGLIVRRDDGVGAAPLAALRPVGKLELRNVPTRLAGLFVPPGPAAEGERPLNLPGLLADTLGATATAAVTTAPVEGAPGTLNALITLNTPTTIAEVNGDVSESQLALRKLAAQTSVTPQTVSGLMQAFAPNVSGVPRLAGPARVIVQADPISVPLREFKPLLDRAGVAGIRVSIPGRTLVDGLQVRREDGTLRELGRVGVDSLEVAAKAPVAALVGPALPEERKVTATVSGTVLGGQDEPLLVLNGRLDTEVSDRRLAGGLTAEARLSDVNTRLVEQLAGRDGLISGAIGNTLSAQLAANLTPPRDAAKGFDFTQATTDVRLTLEAPRLKSDGPIQATIAPAGVTLAKPVRLVMDVEPAWVNKFFEKPLPPNVLAGKPPPPDMQLSRPTSATLAISKLTYPLGEPDASRPAWFEAALSVTVPSAELVTREAQEIRLSQVVIGVDATPVKAADGSVRPGVPVNLRLDVADATVGQQPSAKTMALRGSISDLVDIGGTFTLDAASLTLNGDLPAVPTALVDALLNQDGLIVDALGPVAAVKVQVERYPIGQLVEAGGPPPIVSIQAESQRARAEVRGTIRERAFISERPLEVTIVELTEDLAKRLIKGLPLMGSLSKNSKDAPALITGTGLTVPLGNDMSKLNGTFRIDPGEARFDTSGGFAKLLRGVGQAQSGVVGRRLAPVNVRVVNGVATYERWSIPLGEFQVQTEGTVDLVNRTVNVITYVPFSELSESAAGTLNTSLTQLLGATGGTLVNAATMVPIRTSGPMNNPTTGIDSRLFLENIRKNLKPEDVLGDLLRQQLQPK